MNLKYILSRMWLVGRSLKEGYPYLLADIASPLSLLFVVTILSKGTDLPFALAGGLVSMITIMSINIAGGLAWFRFDIKYKDLIVTTKTSPIDYMLGEISGTLIWALPGIIIYLLMDSYFHLITLYILGMSALILAMVVLAVASIAFWISSVVNHSRHVWAFVGLLSIFLTVVPPTFYPYTYLPKPALYALMVFPSTNAAILEQGLFHLEPMNWYALLVLIVEVVVYFGVARYFTKWREK